MSWWTKNRKKVGLAAGLLGGGALMAASGGTASGLLGLLPEFLGGTAATGSGAAAATLPEALAASQGVGQAALAKGGLDAAIAAEGGSEMGLAGTKAVSDAYFGNAAPTVQKTAGLLGNMGGKNIGTTMMGANLLAGGMQQPPQPPAPPPPPPAPPPAPSTFTGYGQQPPPGIDPMTWAQLPEHLKRQLMQRGQA